MSQYTPAVDDVAALWNLYVMRRFWSSATESRKSGAKVGDVDGLLAEVRASFKDQLPVHALVLSRL